MKVAVVAGATRGIGLALVEQLARLWGGQAFRVERASDLRAALDEAADIKSFVLIEARIDADDLSPISRKYIQASGRKGRGRG